jgi:hypothetical protein
MLLEMTHQVADIQNKSPSLSGATHMFTQEGSHG